MTSEEIIIGIFCRVDDEIGNLPRHAQSPLWPSEIVTIGMLYGLKGVSGRRFYAWLSENWTHLFPHLPCRQRLFCLLESHRGLCLRFAAKPTVLGVADSYGIELIHPYREGRSTKQIGRKGLSNHRWMVGGKLALILNQFGQVVTWTLASAGVHDTKLAWLMAPFKDRMIVLADTGFHAKAGDPANMKVCKRGTWNVRMLIETVFSMLQSTCHCKHATQRTWRHLHAKYSYILAAFNILIEKQLRSHPQHLSLAHIVL